MAKKQAPPLIKTAIVDKNGVSTTRNKKSEASATNNRAANITPSIHAVDNAVPTSVMNTPIYSLRGVEPYVEVITDLLNRDTDLINIDLNDMELAIADIKVRAELAREAQLIGIINKFRPDLNIHEMDIINDHTVDSPSAWQIFVRDSNDPTAIKIPEVDLNGENLRVVGKGMDHFPDIEKYVKDAKLDIPKNSIKTIKFPIR